VTALLFTIGKYLIGLYLGNSSVASTYGAAGSLIILLLWIYYSTQILFFGAELTQVYARRYGSGIEPNKNAVPVEKVKVHPDQLPPKQKDRRKQQRREEDRLRAGDLQTRPHAR
jgi:membrane protein